MYKYVYMYISKGKSNDTSNSIMQTRRYSGVMDLGRPTRTDKNGHALIRGEALEVLGTNQNSMVRTNIDHKVVGPGRGAWHRTLKKSPNTDIPASFAHKVSTRQQYDGPT